MFGMFKNKVRKVAGNVKKMENRNAVEASVWGAYAVAFADGNCEPSEIAILEKTLAATPAFAGFSGEISQMSSNIRARYEASPRAANVAALRELADIAGTPEAEDVIALCLDIAEKEGQIGDDEMNVLKKIAQALQVQLDKFF